MARWAFALAGATLLALACGSGTSPVADLPADTGADTIPDAGHDVQPLPDTAMPDVAEADDTAVPDTATPDVIPDTAVDLARDETPPTVASSDPADEATGVAIPFVVKVTFSEAIRFKETVDANTFRVIDMNDVDLPGTRTYDDATFTLTFTPDASVIYFPASPYRIVMSNLIQDKAGNRMVATTLRFSTTPGQNLQPLEDLAARYSPILYQSVSKTAPQFDYPTAFDFDGDWLGANNDKSLIKAQSIPSWVYYDVVETKTHRFIRYAYFYPRHNETPDSFGNDVAGAIVVVARHPSDTPIAVETYFGAESKEDVRSFVTTESGLVKDGSWDAANGDLNDRDRKYFGVNWVFPQATLFPAGHYQAYLTTGTHESCAWAQTNKETTLDMRCQLNEGIKKTLSIMHYAYVDGTAQSLTKGADGFPISTAEGTNVGYGLRSVLAEWWARRDRVGDIFGSAQPYEAPAGRPGADLLLPTSFVNTLDEANPGGRPPWYWDWKPTVSDPDFYYKEFPAGAIFLDPAYYFSQRHRIVTTTGNSGFSTTYCFNPYLLIDQRDKDPDCAD